jgi:hypothetical protein
MDYKGLGDVEFVQVIDGQSFVIRCRFCDASGRKPFNIDKNDRSIIDFYPTSCPICEGKGMIRLKSPDIPCNCGPCQGTGREPRPRHDHLPSSDKYQQFGAKECGICKGYGILSVTGHVTRASK